MTFFVDPTQVKSDLKFCPSVVRGNKAFPPLAHCGTLWWRKRCWRLKALTVSHRLTDRTSGTEYQRTQWLHSSPIVTVRLLPFLSRMNRASDDGDGEDPELSVKDGDADTGTSSDSTSASAAAKETNQRLGAALVSDSSEYIGPMPQPVSFNTRTAYAGSGSGKGGDHHDSRHPSPHAGTATWRRRVSENGLRHCGGGGAFEVQDPSRSMRRSSTGGIGGRAVYGHHRGDSSESDLTDINDEVRWREGRGVTELSPAHATLCRLSLVISVGNTALTMEYC